MKTATKNQSKNGTNGTSAKTTKTAAKSGAASGLRELFEDQLKDIYWAEKALTKAIPKMMKNATSEELVAALTDHLEVTRNHVTRIEEVFSAIGTKPQAKKCVAMEGLVKEGEEIMGNTEEGVVRDAGIIGAAQKVEHYEIATYGTLAAFAKILDESEAADLLMQTLGEEKEADEKLSEVAETSINLEAAGEDMEREGEEEGSSMGSSKSNTKAKSKMR